MPTILRNKHRPHDPVWHVQIAVVAAIVLQLLLPDRFSVGTRYALPAVEALLLVSLSFTTPKERVLKSLARRINVILLIGVVTAANAYALSQVAERLLQTGVNNGRELILTAINIYLTNIIIFGLWYWEMDGGGPVERHREPVYEADFYFPQGQTELEDIKWHATFADYLYLSSTNAMAFSPTDTMPLTRRAKMLMLLQSVVSLITIALVAARAVNILG